MGKIVLRPVTKEDALLILKWRNDESSRANSFTNELISEDEHLKWFDKKINDKNCHMYMMTDDSECVGHIRVDTDGDEGEISYMIAPEKRGRGYGKIILNLIETEMSDNIKILIGKVKSQNIASARCFDACHYEKIVDGIYKKQIRAEDDSGKSLDEASDCADI